jgi:hypothetical protein
MKIRTRALSSSDFDAELYFLALSLLLAVFLLIAPSGFIALFPCVFKQLTGIPCPTCGITRTAGFLVHGDIRAAWNTSFLFTGAGLLGFGYSLYCGLALALRWNRLRIQFKSRTEFLVFSAMIGALFTVNWAVSIFRHI